MRTLQQSIAVENCPHATLKASGEAVGLMEGQMGDSNGHLNLGAGRIVYQDVADFEGGAGRISLRTNSSNCNHMPNSMVQNCI